MREQTAGATPASKSTMRTLGVTLLVVALVAGGLWSWRASRTAPTGWAGGGPIDVVAAAVKAQAAPVRLEALGELRAVRQVTLSAEVPGRVTAIQIVAGRRVDAGEVLVQLDDALEQAALAAARADASFSAQQLERASQLASTGAMSKEIQQQRQAENDRARAQIAQLEARIRQKRIRAPFSGELGLRRIDVGQYLNAGDNAVTLTDLNRLYVNFDVPQQELGRIRVGQHVIVDAGAGEGTRTRATISAIEPQVGRDTRNASIQAELPNAGRALRPGMFATVSVELPDEADALTLPASAIMTSASGDAVVAVRAQTASQTGKAEIVPVIVGRRLGDRVIVIRGLKDGDVVVTEGQIRIQPGAAVHVVNKQVTAAAAQNGGGA